MKLQISTLVKREYEMLSELQTYYESLALCLESDRPTDEMIQRLKDAARAADSARVLALRGDPLLEQSFSWRLERLKRKDFLAWRQLSAAISNTPFEGRFAKIEFKLRSSHLRSVPKSA